MWFQDEWLKCPKSCDWWPLHYMISLSWQNSCAFNLTPLWNIPFWIGTFPRLLWISFCNCQNIVLRLTVKRHIFFFCVCVSICPMVTVIKSILLAWAWILKLVKSQLFENTLLKFLEKYCNYVLIFKCFIQFVHIFSLNKFIFLRCERLIGDIGILQQIKFVFLELHHSNYFCRNCNANFSLSFDHVLKILK